MKNHDIAFYYKKALKIKKTGNLMKKYSKKHYKKAAKVKKRDPPGGRVRSRGPETDPPSPPLTIRD